MGELTIRGAQAQRNLLEWSQRVAECWSSGQSVTRWCAEHAIKPKTYFNWQKKVFAAMIEQQRQQLEAPQEPERKFAALPVPTVQNDLVAKVRIGDASLDVYSGANAEVVATLCKALSNVTRLMHYDHREYLSEQVCCHQDDTIIPSLTACCPGQIVCLLPAVIPLNPIPAVSGN